MSCHSIPSEDSEYREQYLSYVDSLDLSPKEKFELLYIVHSIMLYFVDTAFDVHTDQFTLRSVGNNGLSPSIDDATIEHHPTNQPNRSQSGGAERDYNPTEPSEP